MVVGRLCESAKYQKEMTDRRLAEAAYSGSAFIRCVLTDDPCAAVGVGEETGVAEDLELLADQTTVIPS